MAKFKKEKILWETIDPLGRKVILMSGSYNHIKICHPREAIFKDKMKEVMKLPISIWEDENIEENKKAWYYFERLKKEEIDLLVLKSRI